jgi:hypothetical protein
MEMTYPTKYQDQMKDVLDCCLNCTHRAEDEMGDSYCTFNGGFEFIRAPRYHSCTDLSSEVEK